MSGMPVLATPVVAGLVAVRSGVGRVHDALPHPSLPTLPARPALPHPPLPRMLQHRLRARSSAWW